MSRQSKNARRLAKAKEITRMHLNGERGPARTTPKHEKRWTYRSNPEIAKRIAEMMKATQAESTVLDKLNAEKAKSAKKSGSAARDTGR